MTRLWTIGFPIGLTLWLLFAGSETTAGSLYRCATDTEGIIYTDNPAQLEQCAPITASGAVTSLATVSSGGPPAGTPPDPLPMAQTLQEPMVVMSPPGSAPQTIDVPPPNAAPNALPCPIGMNPLNPFSSPPCPPTETVPAATITTPSRQDAPPGSPTQP
jgi:hypothetical protein